MNKVRLIMCKECGRWVTEEPDGGYFIWDSNGLRTGVLVKEHKDKRGRTCINGKRGPIHKVDIGGEYDPGI